MRTLKTAVTWNFSIRLLAVPACYTDLLLFVKEWEHS
jgi:hypothetical protein